MSDDIKNENLHSFSTVQKILHLQNLIKEMTSVKGRFIDIKNKMLHKLDSNCYTYFKNKIYMKEVFDYCVSHINEEKKDYELIEDPKDYLNEMYQPLYDFYFLIRNDNSLMLQIIDLSFSSLYPELSDFLVNFLYGNIIQSSFVDEELMVMIYLLLEKLILKTLPMNIDMNKNIPISHFEDNFISHVFRALTRKIDLRNFLCNILNDFILRIESFSLSLSVDINIVNRFLKMRDRKTAFHSFMKKSGSLQDEEVHKIRKQFQRMNKRDNLYKKNTTGNMYLKRANRITLGKSNIFDNNNNIERLNEDGSLMTIEQRLSIPHSFYGENFENNENNENKQKKLSQDLNSKKTECNQFEKRKTVKSDDQKENEKNKEKHITFSLNNNLSNSSNLSLSINNSNSSNQQISGQKEDDLDENGEVKIDVFFEDNSITLSKLKDFLSQYENNKDKEYGISLAMKEYLNILINQMSEEEKQVNKKNKKMENVDSEVYSTSFIIEELDSIRSIKQNDSFRGLMRKIRFNHRIITKIILEIIGKLKDNLVSSPFSLKCISKIIDILLNKKYNHESKNKLSHYQIFMFEINFLIGNIILPILKEPEYNGIVTTNVISQITNDNLKIISDIFEKMITGRLFNKMKEPYMTLFNKFIIDTMPKLFELIESFDHNFELPNKIQYLIKTSDTDDNSKRNINYDYFNENPEENINHESICFSWKNFYILLQIISKNKNKFIDENKNDESKEILTQLLYYEELYISIFTNSIKNKKFEYFYLTKVSYSNYFSDEVVSLTLDNFISVKPKPNDDLITAFKKAIIEMLNYTNVIQKENFYELTESKDEKTIKKKILLTKRTK